MKTKSQKLESKNNPVVTTTEKTSASKPRKEAKKGNSISSKNQPKDTSKGVPSNQTTEQQSS